MGGSLSKEDAVRNARYVRKLSGAAITLGALVLGGCAWLSPPELGIFPDEVVPGWQKILEVPLDADALPVGATGGWGAVWEASSAWLYAQAVWLPSPSAAKALYDTVVASLSEYQTTSVGDEGVKIVHEASGLAVHFFRVDEMLALVGSLAEARSGAPSLTIVEAAGVAIAARIARSQGMAETYSCTDLYRLPLRPETILPRSALVTEVSIPLSLKADNTPQDNGTLTLSLEVVLSRRDNCDCLYTFKAYLKRIAIRGEDGDDWPRGAGDVFVAGIITLPCGAINFRTAVVAKISPNSSESFGDPGRLISQIQCTRPCSEREFTYTINALVRDSDVGDLLGLCAGAIEAVATVAPEKAAPVKAALDKVAGEHGIKEATDPANPITEARNFRGDDLGEGTATGKASLPAPEIQVIESAICRQVSGGTPVGLTRTFSCTDPQVVSWIRVGGVCRDPVTVRWDWYREGARVRTQEAQFVPSLARLGVVSAFDTLRPLNCTTMPGNWRVDTHIDGTRRIQQNFVIEAAPPGDGFPDEAIFGQVEVGSSAKVRFTFGIEPTSELPGTITNIGFGDHFYQERPPFKLTNLPPLPKTLQPGESASWDIWFAPSAIGTYQETMHILVQFGEYTTRRASVTVSGEGVPAQVSMNTWFQSGYRLSEAAPRAFKRTLEGLRLVLR